MHELELLRTIRPIWLDRGIDALARGYGLREHLRSQLEQFFSLLEQAIETGDPAWLDSILQNWLDSLTQDDLNGETANLTRFVNELMLLSFRVCRETLNDAEALHLLSALIAVFSYAIEKTTHLETRAKITFISKQLDEVRQSLEKLDHNKSDFIAVAAHELRTPLTLIEGYSAMLRESLERQKLSPADVVLLEGVQNGTNRLHAIINDMIDVSLIDNNLMQMNFQPVWLNRLFSVLQNELDQTITERAIQLDIKPFPGSSEVTFADPERILQVLRNVLTNAVKYTPDGGWIVVDGRKLPGFVEITVQDSGIGIDLEDQPIIFEKFSRLGSTSLHSSGKTKFKGGGPGLGLRIAKGIIESHGGAVWVESPGYDEKNCPGTTFHILLPMRAEPPDDKMAKIFAPMIQI
jgi:signal transduction histidine kinase